MSDRLEGMKTQYHAAIHEARALAFIKIVHATPEASLAEVAAMADGCGLEHLTIGQCFLGKLPTTGEAWAKRLTAHSSQKALGAAPRKTRARQAKDLNLRTQADRDLYDEAILAFLKKQKDWTSAKDVRSSCGGTGAQARTSLNRLIEAGKVQWKGRAAGVMYKVA